ncbi:methyltransferase domain-containing protein [Clostridium beijerinckii]|uniref:Methyltransferase domain-containing protein n=2 Tax=Clostridium beijerinckii TaxID=1520 RepID=A0AB74VQ08_CLOBE|nr:methyltransferase domain-containing protein [Clostridium beijerinckii]QUN37879.1 methyltransferase domain-containing protein [Clostridium beijerinckii]
MKKQIKENIQVLINDNKLDDAIVLIDEYLKIDLYDMELYSMLSVVYIMQQKINEAKKVLKEALNIYDQSFDLNYNLAYIYEQEGEIRYSLKYYKKALENCNDEKIKLNIINSIKKISNKHSSMVTDDKTKVIFFVKQGMDSFLDDIINNLSEEYETKKIITTEYKQIDEGMEWADICWFEWCDELVAYGSKHKLAKEKKIICRLHRYEVFTNYPKNVEWNNVDKLILVTEHLGKFLASQIQDIEEKVDIITIHNGVNLNKFQLKLRKSGYNIAYIGYIHQRKNPVLLLQIINNLVKIDKRYKLYIAGQFQDSLIELYWNYQIQQMGLNNNIIFQGWQKDISKWLENKNYILSSSIHESFGYGIAEAMSRGIKPVIHDFVFADEIWDKKYLFNSIDEAVNMITEKDYNSQEYRKFIEDNYSLNKQVDEIKELINLTRSKEELSKIEKEELTLDYIYRRFNEFISYPNIYFESYDFKSADITIGKRERVSNEYELIEFILKNNKNKSLIFNNIWYNIKDENIVLPEPMKKNGNIKYITKFLRNILELEVEFVNNIAGFIFDKGIVDDVNKNSVIYSWERAIPASQFMPMLGYLKIAERYIFAASFIKSSDKVLESPCGFGYGAAYFSKICSNVEALDIAEDNIKFGKDIYGFDNINWVNGDVTNLPYKDNEFDIYVSYEVFEHLPLELIEQYLHESKRVIKGNGKFIISTPNAEMRKHINNPFHIKEYSFQEFRNIIEKQYSKIEYYSVSDYKVNFGMKHNAFTMIAVCEK